MSDGPADSRAECPLQIGSRRLATRYLLAPLAGYTQLAFRRVLRSLGGVGLATTDLVHATQLVGGSRKSRELVLTSPDDQPLSVQIFSGQTAHLVAAARWLEDHGYGGVDLNLGCPMGKVNGTGGGARLLCDAEPTTRLVAEVVSAVSIPVTVKMRLGWDRESMTAPQLAAAFEQVGVAGITIHGRTRQQGFGGDVDLAGIRAVVESVRSIPIIGNGDVRTQADTDRMFAETGCHGIAIGRGAMLNPWLLRQLADRDAGHPAYEPTADDHVEFLTRHFEWMSEQHGERACILIRKFAAWYGVILGIPDDLEDRLRRFETPAEFAAICREFRSRHGERQRQIPTALIKVPNGPIEHW